MQLILKQTVRLFYLTLLVSLLTGISIYLVFDAEGFEILVVLFFLLISSPFYFIWYQDVKSLIASIRSVRKYKITELSFKEFPFFLGDRVRAKMVDLPKSFSRMTLELRFIGEDHQIIGESYEERFFQLYKETKIFEKLPLEWDGVLSIDWKLPDDSEFTTILSKQPAKYWELEVKTETTGIDYHTRFLLPVYKPFY